MTFDVPYSWGNAAEATIYRITPEGLQQPERVRVSDAKMTLKIEPGVPYYAIPERETR